MRSSKAQSLINEQLSALPPYIRIVILHPEFRSRHLFTNVMLDQGVPYVCLQGSGVRLPELQAQVAPVVNQGTSTRSRKSSAASRLLLDECDRAEPDALRDLMRMLLSQYQSMKFFLMSRTAPQSLLKDDALRTQTRFIPALEEAALRDYAAHTTDALLMEFRAFGRGRVLLNGAEISKWDGGLPRNLFFYLVDRGMVTRSDIFRTFWPDLSVHEATNVFHVTKRKINEILETDLTHFGSGFYHLSPHLQVAYDVALFNEFYNFSMISSGGESIQVLENAVDLYRGDFLMGLDMDWVIERRETLRSMFNEMMVMLARRYQEAGEQEKAYGAYLRASTYNVQREDLVTQILTLALELKYFDDGVTVYNRFRNELKRKMNLDPSPQVRALYDQLRAARGRETGS